MKIVSLDIETTGLDCNNSSILQIGAVLFDTIDPFFTPIATFKKYIVTENIVGGSVFALRMNSKIIARICELIDANSKLLKLQKVLFSSNDAEQLAKTEKEYNETYESSKFHEYSTIDTITNEFKKWLIDNNAYEVINGKNKLNLSGKNFFAFDNNFLKLLPNWETEIRCIHRTIDPCSLYASIDDNVPPSLFDCKQRAIVCMHALGDDVVTLFDDDVVTHDALDDAMDVSKLIWFGINYKKHI